MQPSASLVNLIFQISIASLKIIAKDHLNSSGMRMYYPPSVPKLQAWQAKYCQTPINLFLNWPYSYVCCVLFSTKNIYITLQNEQNAQNKYLFFPPAIKVFNFIFENPAILLKFILSNCGEFYRKAKNVKYVWSAQLPGQDSRAAMDAAVWHLLRVNAGHEFWTSGKNPYSRVHLCQVRALSHPNI